ncbi:hypothetical protein QTP88_018803 [Uroleucon formosanum]
MTNEIQSNENNATAIDAVANFRLPTFWTQSPAFWFNHAEAMFAAQRITANASKVHYVVGALDQATIRTVGDLLGTSASYEAIRTRLTEAFATSNAAKYRELVRPGGLGDRRPSQLLRDMRGNLPPGIGEEALKEFWMQRLPSNVRVVLHSLHASLDAVAARADLIMDASNPLDVDAVSREIDTDLAGTVAALAKQVQALTQLISSPAGTQQRHSAPTDAGQLPPSRRCYYHETYGAKARKCRPPYLRSSSNEYVCDQSRPCTSNEQYLDTNDTLVISGMSNDVCDSALVEKTNIGTEEEKQLLMRQLQISTGKSICPILRKFAMTLHFYSPSAYSYVRTIFSKALPDVSTIRKWYSKLDGLPGMTKESFQAISLKVKEMKVNGKQLYGCLVMDEMTIKQHVHWTGTRHQGYIDFGLGGKTEEMDNLPYAKDAFVIMVVDINTSWKVPIAYYLINGISAEEKANIILNCLQELDTTGVIIKTLTFDGAANNLSMASELEANLQYSELKPYFLHPNTNDKKLPWRLEDINESGLHSATKLRNRHIYYFREKMKVRLAVQTFSTSVANAILFCMNDLKLDNFQGADATIEFCLSINNIFDILNTRNFLSKGTYNKSINKRTKTEIFHYIEESIDYLAGGFNALKNQQNVDHIEMLFSAIRAKGGFNNNPTVSQFEAAYKSIIVHSEIKSSSSANCMALDDTTILTVSSSNIKVKDTQSELLDLLCVAGSDDLENDNLVSVYQHSNFINDVVACIAGFVVRKIKKKQFYVIHVL